MKIKTIIPAIIIFVSFLTALCFYPRMPQVLVSHWGINGQPNGYSSKDFGLFFMPVFSILLYTIFLFLPKFDPYKKNFEEFRNYYETFVVLVFCFLFYIYYLTIVWNLGYQFEMIRFLSPALALIFAYAGFLMSKTKRNWFVGIRTPWTITSKSVWTKTHKLGSKLFYFSSASTLLGIFFPLLAFYLMIVPILFSVGFLFVFSYLEYQKPKKH